jgi:hypothetical protein
LGEGGRHQIFPVCFRNGDTANDPTKLDIEDDFPNAPHFLSNSRNYSGRPLKHFFLKKAQIFFH